ncbi:MULTISPECIES: hypothetical protein [Vibrio]|nr:MULTISPECIES: hypothetical protein [Vibrio]
MTHKSCRECMGRYGSLSDTPAVLYSEGTTSRGAPRRIDNV